MKTYRIIKKNINKTQYYKVQRNILWIFWIDSSSEIHMSIGEAEVCVKNLILNKKPEPKTVVVKRYTEADFIIDKLKGVP